MAKMVGLEFRTSEPLDGVAVEEPLFLLVRRDQVDLQNDAKPGQQGGQGTGQWLCRIRRNDDRVGNRIYRAECDQDDSQAPEAMVAPLGADGRRFMLVERLVYGRDLKQGLDRSEHFGCCIWWERHRDWLSAS
jgi:hypothetical protein